MAPGWLHALSIAYLAFGGLCALVAAIDVTRRPQPMWIMNIVWPVTALFGGVLVLWLYFTYGRRHGDDRTPFPIAVANGTLHCGSGCTLGDIIAEWLAFAFPAVPVAFGYGSLFGTKMFAVWILDYIFAYVLGVFFQYFTIAPMRGLSFWPGLRAAIKADTLSLTAWQVGMYGFMAIAVFLIFRHALGADLRTDMPEFWFMMQIAMICGFVTAYPVNWWLLRVGIKEPM